MELKRAAYHTAGGTSLPMDADVAGLADASPPNAETSIVVVTGLLENPTQLFGPYDRSTNWPTTFDVRHVAIPNKDFDGNRNLVIFTVRII